MKEQHRDTAQSRTVYLLLMALAVGAVLRLYGLTERGIFDYDEAWYLLEAKSVYDAGTFLTDRLQGEGTNDALGPAIKGYLRERGTVPHTSFKPGHVLLVLASLVVFGLHDYAPFVFSALFGIGTAVLVYFIGCKIGTRREALFAAALLACSASHIPYSRSSYAQADSVFFVTLGVWLWVRSFELDSIKSVAAAGAALGFAVTCHYNTALVPACVVTIDLARRLIARDAFIDLGRRCVAWTAGVLAAPLLFEVPARIAKGSGLVPSDFLTYVEQYTNRDTGGMVSSIRWTLDAFPHVTDHFLSTEGLPVILVGLFGLLVLTTQLPARPLRGALLISLGVLPALGWLFAMKEVDVRFRTFPVAFPFLAMIGGIGLSQAIELAKRASIPAKGLTIALVILICSNGIIRAQPIVHMKSGYREATHDLLQYAQHEGGTIGFRPGSSWPIYYFYLSAAYDDLDQDLQSRIDFYRQKDQVVPAGDFEPADMWRYWRGYRMTGGDRLIEHLERLRTERSPIVGVPNPLAEMPSQFREAFGDSAQNCYARILATPGTNAIWFYDLRNDFEKPALAVRQVGR